MKIVVFGGAGDMGSEAVRDIAAAKNVDSLLIADYNKNAAARLAADIDSEFVESTFCDANDHNSLVELMSGADVCLSCIGPFYEYESKMVRAAIDAKVNYVSICDDFDAAEAALAMDKPAKKAGITVLNGMGWTPGLSNVLARKGIDELEEAREVHIAWAGGADDSEGLAVIKHTLHIFTGDVPTYSSGRWKRVPAGSDREKVAFPDPIGKISVYNLGHPEPVTIPHFIPGLEEVTLKGAVTPEWVNPMAKALSAAGLTNSPRKRDIGANFFHRFGPTLFKSKGKPISGIHVKVVGTRNGQPATFIGTCVDNMKRLTGIPAAIGTLMVGAGQVEAKGVVAPETAIEPELFFTEIKKRGMKVQAGFEK